MPEGLPMLENLGEAAIRTLLLTCVVQAALRLLRVRQARLLLAAWTVVLVASVAMPVIQRQAPFYLLPRPELPTSLIDGATAMLARSLLPGLDDGPEGRVATSPSSEPSHASWAVSVYLIIGAGMLLRILLGVALCCRLVVRAVPIHAGWTRGARVRISRHVTGPVTIANVILLPVGVLDWPADVRQAVLAHEQAHVARCDFATLTASQINRCLFWFSPVSWWLHRRLVALTERASDDAAIAISGDRLRYAEILLEMARHAGPVSQGLAMARPATIADRVDRILLGLVDPYPVDRGRLTWLMIAAASLAVVAASMAPRAANRSAAASVFMGRYGDDALATRIIADAPALGDNPARRLSADVVLPAPTVTPQQPAREVTAQKTPGARPVLPLPGSAALVIAKASRAPSKASRRLTASNASAYPLQTTTRLLPAVQALGKDDRFEAAASMERLRLPAAGLDLPAIQPSISTGLEAIRYRSAPPPPLPAEFQGLIGRTCTGAVTIGRNARTSPDRQPDVVAGQRIAAHASFYVKPNGTVWVRFDAFGQQSLDLPLRFNQYGLTWTGGHGVTYTVQPAAGSRLIGLAGFFRNDSAGVDLTCW